MNAVGVDGDVRTLLHEGGPRLPRSGQPGRAATPPTAKARSSFARSPRWRWNSSAPATSRSFYGDGRRQPLLPPASGRDRLDPPVDRDGRCLPALGLRPPRNTLARRPPGRLERPAGSLRWRLSIGRATRKRPIGWHGTASFISSCTRSITSSTESRSSAPCRSGGGAWSTALRAVAELPARPWPIGEERGPCPSLFEAAGAKFDFSEASLAPLMDAIGRELDQLGP